MSLGSLGLPELLFFGALFALLALLKPKAALFVILPTIALAPETQAGGIAIRPDDLMIAVLAISWGLRRLGRTVGGTTPLDQPLIWYFIAGLAATFWGAAIGTADLVSLDKFSASGLHLLKRLEFVLLYFIIKDSIRSVADARRLIYIFMGSLAALSAYSLDAFRSTGTIALAPGGSPIHEPGLASMLNVALALGFLVGPGGFVRSLAMIAILFGSLYALPFGLGRNYLSATFLMLAIIFLWRKRSLLVPLSITSVVVIALTGAVLFPKNVTERFLTLRSAFNASPEASELGVSIFDRFTPGILYSSAVLNSSPLLGWGFGSVALGSIDSEYAGQLIYTGILGFLVFASVVLRIVRTVRVASQAANDRDPPAVPLIAGLQHCLLGYALYSFFSPSISAARAGAFFFTILGLVAVLYRELSGAAVREESSTGARVDREAGLVGIPATWKTI